MYKMYYQLIANDRENVMRKISILIFISTLVLGSPFALAEINYKKILFPKGIPSDIVDGVKPEAVLKIHSKKQVSKDGFVVLYSTVQDSGLGIEKLFTVYLSLVEIKTKKTRVKSTNNLTKYLKTYVELPGICKEMDAIMELFKISDKMKGIHVNLWSIISGSGAHSSSTDLFYSIDSETKIQMVLSVVKSSQFSKTRQDIFNSKNSYIYYSDPDADEITDILVLETNYKRDQTDPFDTFSFSPNIRVYKFDGESYLFFKSINLFTEKIVPLTEFQISNKIIFSNISEVLDSLFNSRGTEND